MADCSAVSLSAAWPPTGLRTTTGGIGREPGMLIRILVVSVCSVRGSSAACSCSCACPAREKAGSLGMP
ncbi:hypothetical protein GXW82_28350 [Streptacidiphilus sp. 4-A2]|nr:hypothetical protein [Streptacidiphilus sp. 4-A2]